MAKEIATKTKLDTRIAADIAAAMPVASKPVAAKAATAAQMAKKAIVIDSEEVQATADQTVVESSSADVIVAQAAGASSSSAAGGAAAGGMSTTALVVAGVAVAAAAGSSSSSSPAGSGTNTGTGGAGATAAVTGKTISLSANADGPSAVAPAVDTTGTEGADTYLAADTTLTSADMLDGKGGNDVLTVRVAAVGNVIPSLTSIETVRVTQLTGAGDHVMNFVNSTGLTTAVALDQVAGGTTTFNNMAAGVTLSLDNVDGTVDGNFLGAAGRTGTADAFSLNIANGTGTAATSATLNIHTAAAAADASFENVNISTSGAASYITTADGDASFRVFTVTGDAAVATTSQAGQIQGYALTIADAGATAVAMRTVTASGMTGTGGLNVDLSASTQTTIAFTGSASNDRVLLDGGVINANNTFALNGGEGSMDVLAVDAITDFGAAGQAVLRTTVNAATGFEALEATAADVTALNADNFTTINRFIFSGTQTLGNAITNIRTGENLYYTVDSTRAGDILTLSGAVAGQNVDVHLTGGVDLVATGAGNAITVDSGINTVNIHSTNPQGLAAADAVNRISAATTVAAIDNVTATTFVADGNAGLTIGAVAALAAPVGFTAAVNFNASALTGILRIAGSGAADSITGGTAGDIIYGRGGNDSLTGGGGADQFRLLLAADGTDTITDFTAGTDLIGIGEATLLNLAGSTGAAAGTAVAVADYEQGRNAITDIVAGDTLNIIELQQAATTAQIGAQLGAAADALVVVFNSTTAKAEIWYDTDWSDIANRVQLATLDNFTTLVQTTGLTSANFVEFVV